MAILLIDTDLGFLFWLGRMLDKGGYKAFPAKSVPDAVALLADLHLTVNLVILNWSLPGAEGLVAAMRQAWENLKVISLATDERAPVAAGADAVCCKPVELYERSRTMWLQAVREVLSPETVATAS
jgi:DNA-binding response OmpR family regulator